MHSSHPPAAPGAAAAGTHGQRLRAYGVHLYTALGVAFAFLAAAEICAPQPDPRWVFVWLIIAVLIDATDGPLARAWQVHRYAASIQGRTIDDIVDYLTFTFLPLLLVWRLQWLPWPAGAWAVAAMVASLFGFANTRAKQDEDGFFRGFPSYWNVFAFYAGLWVPSYGTWLPALVLGVCALGTVLPVRFLYPNRAPRRWRWLLNVSGAGWLLLLLLLLPYYPLVPQWLIGVSLFYPVLYVGLSIALDLTLRKSRGSW